MASSAAESHGINHTHRANAARVGGGLIMVIAAVMVGIALMSFTGPGIQEWVWMLLGALAVLAIGIVIWTLGNIELHLLRIRQLLEETGDREKATDALY